MNWKSAVGTASRIVVRLPVTPGCAPASTTAMVGGGKAVLTGAATRWCVTLLSRWCGECYAGSLTIRRLRNCAVWLANEANGASLWQLPGAWQSTCGVGPLGEPRQKRLACDWTSHDAKKERFATKIDFALGTARVRSSCWACCPITRLYRSFPPPSFA